MGPPFGQLIEIPPENHRMMAGVCVRETELSKSLGRSRICSSEKQEIAHKLREG